MIDRGLDRLLPSGVTLPATRRTVGQFQRAKRTAWSHRDGGTEVGLNGQTLVRIRIGWVDGLNPD